MAQQPTSWDMPNPQKSLTLTYDPAYLRGTISAGGSISSAFDLCGWSQFALQLPVSGTILGGTSLSIWAAESLQGTYNPYYGTTAVAQTVGIGSTGNQVIGPITSLEPLRFVKFVAGGTQSAAQVLTLIVK